MGVNYILCREFLLIVPLTKPYKMHGPIELFMNVFSFIGFIHRPVYEKLWPETGYYVEEGERCMENVIKSSQKL